MNIAICSSNKSPREQEIIKAFHQGIKSHLKKGDETLLVNSVPTCEKYVPRCQVALMYGWFNPLKGAGSKKAIRHRVVDLCKKVIVIDSTFIGSDNYVSIGINGIKNNADFCIKQPMPDDRWELISQKENLQLKPWQPHTENGHILILGQNRFGVSSYDIDVWKWHIEIATELLKITNREIRFRIHPRGRFAQALENFPKDKRITISQDNKPLKEDLKNCHCAITYTSNAACEALLEGVSVISIGKGSPVYDITDHDLSCIETVISYNREQWLYDLCYKQWSIEEIRKGLPWLHLRGCC
jgi:hypothetical protein